MTNKNLHRWSATVLAAASAAFVFQSGCAVDPDLFLQSAIQYLTEFAIFITDSVVVGLR